MKTNQIETIADIFTSRQWAWKTFKLWAWFAVLVFGVELACRAAEDILATPAEAENVSLPWDKGSITFGGFITDLSSDVTFGIQGAGSKNLNAENLLGLDSNLAVFRVGAMYRPGK